MKTTKIINAKVRGATLIEVLVSMVIIMGTLALALMIHTNVMNSSKHRLVLEAQLRINDLAQQSRQEGGFFDDLLELERFSIRQSVSEYQQGNERLLLVVIEAVDGDGEVIASRRELIVQQ